MWEGREVELVDTAGWIRRTRLAAYDESGEPRQAGPPMLGHSAEPVLSRACFLGSLPAAGSSTGDASGAGRALVQTLPRVHAVPRSRPQAARWRSRRWQRRAA